MNPIPISAEDRRRLSREARDAFPPMGVYAIRTACGTLVRVGSSRNVHGMLNRIAFELRLGTHPDKELQSAWTRDPSGIRFEVLALLEERIDPAFDYLAELRALEALYREELCAESRQ